MNKIIIITVFLLTNFAYTEAQTINDRFIFGVAEASQGHIDETIILDEIEFTVVKPGTYLSFEMMQMSLRTKWGGLNSDIESYIPWTRQDDIFMTFFTLKNTHIGAIVYKKNDNLYYVTVMTLEELKTKFP